MDVRDLKYGDLVELWKSVDFRYVLSDEFDINVEENTFVADEDDDYTPFSFISKIWREDQNGNYILIFDREGKSE